MGPFVLFIAFSVTLDLVFGETLNNVTGGVQDYFKASQLELLHTIEIAEMKIASIDASFASRLDVIQYEQHQMLNEIQQVNQTLTPLQSLNFVRKHCIQKYDSQLMTQSNARLRLKICNDKAKLGIESLTANAKATVHSTKSYAISHLLKNVQICSSSHLKNETALELCYIENVESATNTVRNYLKTAQDHLEKSVYESSVISRAAIRCSYQVTSEVLKTLGSSLKDIVNCQKDFIKKEEENQSENHNLITDHGEVKVEEEDNENMISPEDYNHQ